MVISFVTHSVSEEKMPVRFLYFKLMLAGAFFMQIDLCLFCQEFIQLYQILLPRGLLSSQDDVKVFLMSMNLNMDNFQIGKNKVSLGQVLVVW